MGRTFEGGRPSSMPCSSGIDAHRFRWWSSHHQHPKLVPYRQVHFQCTTQRSVRRSPNMERRNHDGKHGGEFGNERKFFGYRRRNGDDPSDFGSSWEHHRIRFISEQLLRSLIQPNLGDFSYFESERPHADGELVWIFSKRKLRTDFRFGLCGWDRDRLFLFGQIHPCCGNHHTFVSERKCDSICADQFGRLPHVAHRCLRVPRQFSNIRWRLEFEHVLHQCDEHLHHECPRLLCIRDCELHYVFQSGHRVDNTKPKRSHDFGYHGDPDRPERNTHLDGSFVRVQ